MLSVLEIMKSMYISGLNGKCRVKYIGIITDGVLDSGCSPQETSTPNVKDTATILIKLSLSMPYK